MPKQAWDLTHPDEARARYLPLIEAVDHVETLPTHEALGRVLRDPVTSPETLPAFRRSTVDGYAVRAVDVSGAGGETPIDLALIGEVPMGDVAPFEIAPGETAVVHTGGMVPDGADAVVMLEVVEEADGVATIYETLDPGANIIDVGEDITAGDPLLPAGHRLRERDIGGLMAVGIVMVTVVARPRVAIFSSGDEVIDPASTPRIGQVRDINSYTLAVLVEEAGGIAERRGLLPDDFEALTGALQTALDEGADMIVVTAGSSVSDRDMTADAFNTLGDPGVLIHGLSTKPGKPTILGMAGSVPLIGLPGNPMSAYVQFVMTGVPALYRLQGGEEPPSVRLYLPLSADLTSDPYREEHVPCRLITVDGKVVAEPITYKSNLIFRLIEADGWIKVPLPVDYLAAGEVVEVRLL